MNGVAPQFEEELKAFEARKPELLSVAEGKFAVFKGSEYLGVFDSPAAAYDAAVSKFGDVPFLVRQVRKVERMEQAPALSLGLLNARP
jgi:hypothetical protein